MFFYIDRPTAYALCFHRKSLEVTKGLGLRSSRRLRVPPTRSTASRAAPLLHSSSEPITSMILQPGLAEGWEWGGRRRRGFWLPCEQFRGPVWGCSSAFSYSSALLFCGDSLLLSCKRDVHKKSHERKGGCGFKHSFVHSFLADWLPLPSKPATQLASSLLSLLFSSFLCFSLLSLLLCWLFFYSVCSSSLRTDSNSLNKQQIWGLLGPVTTGLQSPPTTGS